MIIHCTNNSLLRLIAFITLPLTVTLAFTESLALCEEVITKHRAQNKVLFRRKLVKRTSNNQPDGIETFLAAELEVVVVLTRRLHHEINILSAESLRNKRLVLL